MCRQTEIAPAKQHDREGQWGNAGEGWEEMTRKELQSRTLLTHLSGQSQLSHWRWQRWLRLHWEFWATSPVCLFNSPVCSVCPRKCSNSCEPWGYCESFVQPMWSYGSWSWLLRKFSFLKSQTYERNGETIDPILVLVFGSRKIQILIRFW